MAENDPKGKDGEKGGKKEGAADPGAEPGAKKKDEKITEKLPPKMMAALSKEGYKLEQVMATRSYKEQKLWRVVTTDGQRHEISYDGKYLGETPSARKARVAAEAKKKGKNKK